MREDLKKEAELQGGRINNRIYILNGTTVTKESLEKHSRRMTCLGLVSAFTAVACAASTVAILAQPALYKSLYIFGVVAGAGTTGILSHLSHNIFSKASSIKEEAEFMVTEKELEFDAAVEELATVKQVNTCNAPPQNRFN